MLKIEISLVGQIIKKKLYKGKKKLERDRGRIDCVKTHPLEKNALFRNKTKNTKSERNEFNSTSQIFRDLFREKK